MSRSSVIVALKNKLVSPKGTQEGEEFLPSSNHQTAATPKSAQDVNIQDTGRDS